MEQAFRPITAKINVPFCLHDCAFCTRDTIKGRDTQRMHFYSVALCREIEANAEAFADCEIAALHFGGGLASSLGGPDLWQIVKTLRENYKFAENAPVTVRASLLDINVGCLPFFRRSGVTRYDFEVMSMEPLDFIHLKYPDTNRWIQDVSNVLHAARNNNMGAVLLFGEAKTKVMHLRRSLLNACRRNVVHIQLQEYMGADRLPREELAELLDNARGLLQENGFSEYLPLRFAKAGCEDEYAILRARGVDTLAFGMGAVTRFEGVQTTNTMDMANYFCNSADFKAITIEAKNV